MGCRGMANLLIYQQRWISLILLVFLLIYSLVISKAEAKTKANLDSFKTSTIDLSNFPKKSIKSIKSDKAKFKTPKIAQNTNTEPVKVFPYPNGIDVNSPLYPPYQTDSDSEQTDITTEENVTPDLPNKDLEIIILNALTNSAIRYPWIIDPRV